MSDIDRQVAEQVMGWKQRANTMACYDEDGDDFLPSDNISDAWLVVEKMRNIGWQLELDVQEGAYFVPVVIRDRINTRAFCTDIYTYPEAISRAALEAVK